MSTKPHGKQAPAVILVKAYDDVLWSVQKAEEFPRSLRFSLGEWIVQGSPDLLMTLVDATYSRDKSALLTQGNRALNSLRSLFRLAKDRWLVSNDVWAFLAERLDEFGRIKGGWLKAARET